MSLVECPECGKKVSSTAGTCPHCGYALARVPEAERQHERIVHERRAPLVTFGNLVIGVLAVTFVLLVILWWLGIFNF